MDCGSPGKPLTYRDAGVDIDAGNRLVERIKAAVKDTHTDGALGEVGGFGGLFRFPTGEYRDPVLVAGTDGVGTKLKLALEQGRHHTMGLDLVAMSVNDVIAQGAKPLFFLDYFATARLDVEVAARVVEGVAAGCKLAGAVLLGGETAEMPDMYAPGDYDLAGFCVGVVEREQLITGARVAPGDRVIGIASSGPHANGFSLIRRVLERHDEKVLHTAIDGRSLVDLLLEPTTIYVRQILGLMPEVELRAVAHITGGGLPENLPRVLPHGCAARVDRGAWPRPAVFDWLQRSGVIPDEEMWRTFNNGIGMVAVVPEEQATATLEWLEHDGLPAWAIGEIVASPDPGAPAAVVFL